MILAAIASVEDKPAGRPVQAEESGDIAVLRARVAELEHQLQAARLSAEIAVALPQVTLAPAAPVTRPTAATEPAAPQKKRRRRKRR